MDNMYIYVYTYIIPPTHVLSQTIIPPTHVLGLTFKLVVFFKKEIRDWTSCRNRGELSIFSMRRERR